MVSLASIFNLSAKTLDPLVLHFQYCKARLFESILYRSQHLEELVPTFLSRGSLPQLDNMAVNPSYVRAILGLVTCCHSILQTFISMEDILLRCCPTVTYARSLYALKVLFTLRQALRNPEHAVCRIIDDESLRISTFTGALIDELVAAGGELKCRVPMIILEVVLRITGQSAEAALVEHNNQCLRPDYDESPSLSGSKATRASKALHLMDSGLHGSDTNGSEQPSFAASGDLPEEVSEPPSSTWPPLPAIPMDSLDTQGYSDLAMLSDFRCNANARFQSRSAQHI